MLPSVNPSFRFRVLRENRRLATDASRREELNAIHDMHTYIFLCRDTDRVRSFLVHAYVQGALMTADVTDFEAAPASSRREGTAISGNNQS